MVECNKVNVRLSDSKSNKLKTAVKNQIGVALRKNIKMFNGNKQVTSIIIVNNKTKNKAKKCIWNNKSTDTNFSKT